MKEQDFGKKLEELEAITEWFESDKVDLNEALGKFERGMQLAEDLKKELEVIENKVEKIKQKFDGSASAPAVETAADANPDLFAE
ncbi:MAG TPA: exodeoxyribonuclease VII small subunit [Candidatus Dormibacteraeota bacterium]|nr:exodeoxyribonuclease VII small subunit [Candidatus Dormibacteraeota bacterium]